MECKPVPALPILPSPGERDQASRLLCRELWLDDGGGGMK